VKTRASEIGRVDLGKLTFAKGSLNTAIRWLPFFLPTLAVAFDSTTAQLALLLGVAEASGLSTAFVGRWLDAGKERLVIIAALLSLVISSALALVGSIWFFAAAVVVLGAASGMITVSGHAWISARVDFDRRARFIGIYEISWASALLVGVPGIAGLINAFGWRGPFIAVAIAGVVAALLVATIDDGDRDVEPATAPKDKTPITLDAWLIIGVSASVALAGLAMIAIVGTWLDDVLGVSTAGIGLVAISFGVAEFLASIGSSAFADRFGKRRTMQFSVTFLLFGLGVISSADSSLLIGTLGLIVFFLGFEYSIVTSFSLVSEAMPEARGRALGVGNATSTVFRGMGVAAAGILYESFDIGGPVALAAVGASVALLFLTLVGQRRPDLA
jgi:DHA1 family inner membrane transport protein